MSYSPCKLYQAILMAVIASVFMTCEDPFQYNPNEVLLHEDEKDLNAKNISRISAIPAVDTLIFIVISDIHMAYEELEDFVDVANNMQQISFIAITGDLTNFGLQAEYREVHAILKNLKVPFIAVIGNHDLLGNGSTVFREMFGPLNFTFTCNGNKFICMDSNSREYNFNGYVPDLSWLNQELSESGYANLIMLSHIAPFDHDFDPALEEGFSSALAGSERIRLSLHGHSHAFYQADHYDDGIFYQITDDMMDRGYTQVKVWNDGFTVTEMTY